MRRNKLFFITLMILSLALLLTACGNGAKPTEENKEEVAQTEENYETAKVRVAYMLDRKSIYRFRFCQMVYTGTYICADVPPARI